MNKIKEQPLLFLQDEFEEINLTPSKVYCLGLEFKDNDERRQYFREELRKKLPEIKTLSGYPIGSDDDIINLSDPPYFTACPNPWIKSFIDLWEQEKNNLEKEGKRTSSFKIMEPYADDISVGKNNPIYNAHSYHTKVPHPAIMELLYHYTQPGDIVYDGFAGTGMTGVAAGMCKHSNTRHMDNVGERHCICSDLSPIASFIAYNLNINTSEKLRDFSSIVDSVENEYGYMYKTRHGNTNGFGDISYVVWSDKILCPHCQAESLFWDVFVEYGKGNIKDVSKCPHCGGEIKRSSCKKLMSSYYDNYLNETQNSVESVPVLIAYKYNGKRYTKYPDESDYKLIEEIKQLENKSWVPTNLLGDGDKSEDPHAKGVYHIHQFYTSRTLFIISKIWERCSNLNWFCITNSISRNLTKLNRFIVNKYNPNGRINGPLSGTLYVPSEVVEQNVFELLRSKESSIENYFFNNVIQIGDALNNTMVPNDSVDYIFTDPPFGANIMYSELNKITESWLKVLTQNTDEAIENKTQGKDSITYQKLMTSAFKDYFRILKPGKWMTVEFSNTSARIWNAIQYAISSAGFVIVNVSSFDKVHGGIKSMRYTTSVKEDLIITCYKPDDILKGRNSAITDNQNSVWNFIEELLQHLPVHIIKENKTTAIIERSPKILYDKLISYYVQHGYAVPIDALAFQKGLKERFIERDGMYFTASQTIEYEEKKSNTQGIVQMAIFIGSEAEGIEWLKRELEIPKTYQELQPEWMKSMTPTKKGDILPELSEILEENFIKDEDGKWRKPNSEKAADLEIIRCRKMMKEFNLYLEQAQKPRAKRIKDTRLEVLRYGFKECYKQKDFKAILLLADHIQESLLQEDEVLLQYYDIALSRA